MTTVFSKWHAWLSAYAQDVSMSESDLRVPAATIVPCVPSTGQCDLEMSTAHDGNRVSGRSDTLVSDVSGDEKSDPLCVGGSKYQDHQFQKALQVPSFAVKCT